MKMAKKKVKLTERELHDIIRESVDKILAERQEEMAFDIDISAIPTEVLKMGYFDYSKVPQMKRFDDELNEDLGVKKLITESLSPNEVVDKVRDRFQLPPHFVVAREAFHKIYVYVITASIGDNPDEIINFMKKLGYFLSNRTSRQNVKGMVWETLQFEPTSQLQDDITDKLKEAYSSLYHWTQLRFLENIMSQGLKPSSRNDLFSYPDRIYLMEPLISVPAMINLGRQLFLASRDPQNNGEYVLLAVDLTKLNEAVRLFYDPNSELGVFTEQQIPSSALHVMTGYNFIHGKTIKLN